jgi:hypothetical protein
MHLVFGVAGGILLAIFILSDGLYPNRSRCT